jgi:hypothetical protein
MYGSASPPRGAGTTRGTLTLLGAFAAFSAVVLALDVRATPEQHLALGLVAWGFFALALWKQPRDVRVQVAILVCVATILEIVGSIVWRAYTYRLEDLPLYVPAGHGLFYLCALRVAALPALAERSRPIVLAVTAGATAWMIAGLVRPPLPDLLGFVVWAVFIRFVVRGRYPLLYAVSFVMTAGLEVYGTALGAWRWAPVLPGLMLPAGNPPACIGSGYAAMDALTRRIVGRIALWRSRRALAPALLPREA